MSVGHELALSTMYFQRFEGADTLEPFFAAGAEMGFRRFELSHILERNLVDAIASDQNHIVALHHPCPTDPSDQVGLSLCAVDADARSHAADRLLESIESAARLNVDSLVLHLGRLEGEAAERCRRLEFELDARLRAGQAERAEFQRAADSLRLHLARAEAPCSERALNALEKPLIRARQLGVRIGMETGYSALELPTAQGMGWLLDRLGASGFSSTVGAWLDTGHVAARAAIGLDGFEAYFEAVSGRWIGVHLHDCVARRDHLSPGAGHVDFPEIARQLPDGIVHTCELDWYLTYDEIRAGRDHLLKSGFGGG